MCTGVYACAFKCQERYHFPQEYEAYFLQLVLHVLTMVQELLPTTRARFMRSISSKNMISIYIYIYIYIYMHGIYMLIPLI